MTRNVTGNLARSNPPAKTRPGSNPTPRRNTERWWLVAPALLVLAAGTVVPLVYSIWTSVVTYDLRTPGHPFVGFENFRRAIADPNFRRSLIFSFVIALVVTTIEVVLAYLLAEALNRKTKRWRQLLLPLFIAPMFISAVVVGQIWRLLVSRSFGPLNYVLELIAGREINVDWQLTAPWNLLTIVAADVWQWTPLPLLIILAALSGLDSEIVAAAEVDGAGPWARTRYIVLPLIAPVLGAAAFFRFGDALRMYDTIFVLTGGGPGRTTSTVTFYLVEKGFGGSFDLGLTSAASWIFLLLVSVLLFGILRRMVLS